MDFSQVLLILSTGALLPLAGVATYNLFTARRLDSFKSKPDTWVPKVSVLVSARDEAKNLRAHLPALLRSHYPNLEVLVLDDRSADGTLALLQEIKKLHPSVTMKIYQGAPLPVGWSSKNWACHQLSRKSSGEVMIFVDADVAAGPHSIGRTVQAMRASRADVLTALPHQRMVTWTERAVIPLILHLPVLCMAPFRWMESSTNPRISIGSGHWLAFKKEAYAAVGGHQAVMDSALEYMKIVRNAKRLGLRVVPVIASRDLSVRMFRNWREIQEGFSQNLYLLVGRKRLRVFVVLLLMGLVFWVPMLPLQAKYLFGIPLVLLLFIRVLATGVFRTSSRSVLWHPVGAVLLPFLLIFSERVHKRKVVLWRSGTTPFDP